MKPSAPRLSIIIATWNAARTFERCVSSITGQTFADWELLVTDGGSTDDTVGMIRRDAGAISWWQSRADAGIYDAWNQALAHAKGEYVCFLGADDALHAPDTLARLFAAIGAERYDLVTSRGRLRDAAGTPKQEIGSTWEDAKMPRRIRVCHPALLHHRSLFERYGLFDARYKVAGDLDFLLRLPANTPSLHIPLVTVDIQDDGISNRNFWLRIREYRQIHAASPRIGPAKAWLYWADKAWRRPIAMTLGLPH